MNFSKEINKFGISWKTFQASLFLIMAAGCAMFSQGCSDEVIQKGEIEAPVLNGDKIFFSLNIAAVGDVKTGTRTPSTDYPHDTEYDEDLDHLEGADYENTISEMAVILVNPEDHNTVIISIPFNKGISEPVGDEKVITGKAELDFSKDADIKTFINEGLTSTNKKVKAELYVICNYSGNITLPKKGNKITELALLSVSSDSDLRKYGGKTTGTETSSVAHPFLMTNADYLNKSEDEAHDKYITTIDITKLLAATDINNPYNINPKASSTNDSGDSGSTVDESDVNEASRVIIPVQRALARIDLNINSTTYYFDELGNVMNSSEEISEDWVTKLKIDYVGLANINKNFNLFKASGVKPTIDGSSTGTFGTDWKYFWAEMPSSGEDVRYVQDPKYASKAALISSTPENVASPANSYYYNYFFDRNYLNNIRTPYNKSLGQQYNYELTSTDYIIWRYVTPNTIHEANKQKVSITTGVVFLSELQFNKFFEQEGVMENPAHSMLKDKEGEEISYPEFDATPIYMWNGTPIGTNRRLQEIVKNPKNSRQLAISAAYKEAVSSEDSYESFDKWKEKWHKNGTEEKPEWIPTWADFTAIEDWDYTYDEPDYLNDDNKTVSESWKTWAEDTKEGEGFDGSNELTNLEKKKLHFLAYNVLPENFAGELVKNGFSIIVPTPADDKGHSQYLCYYYGWIRHNNNNDPLVMGPMEFGVVRNNVYQISVKSIKHIGHPLPGDIPTDPEPPTPDEDDEPKDPYIELGFKSLPWNVKVNDDIILGH